MSSSSIAEFLITHRGQRWIQQWHPPTHAPAGQANGSAGLCLTGARDVVLISSDPVTSVHKTWDLPGGRPEPGETWEQTLRREVLEEACAEVHQPHLLGYARGRPADDDSAPWLIRSLWLAKVTLNPWLPQFETRSRKTLPFATAIEFLSPDFRPLWNRVFEDAILVMTNSMNFE